MMTVRFPSGFSVQYNTAHYVRRVDAAAGFVDLYTKKDGTWIAHVPTSCVIESVPACRTYNAADEKPWERVTEMAREIRLLKQKVNKLAKVNGAK